MRSPPPGGRPVIVRWGKEDLNLHATPVMQPGCAHPAGWSTVAPDSWSGASTNFAIAPFQEPSPEGWLGQPGPGSVRGLRYWPPTIVKDTVIYRLAPCGPDCTSPCCRSTAGRGVPPTSASICNRCACTPKSPYVNLPVQPQVYVFTVEHL